MGISAKCPTNHREKGDRQHISNMGTPYWAHHKSTHHQILETLTSKIIKLLTARQSNTPLLSATLCNKQHSTISFIAMPKKLKYQY